jgi:hypothetical protein
MECQECKTFIAKCFSCDCGIKRCIACTYAFCNAYIADGSREVHLCCSHCVHERCNKLHSNGFVSLLRDPYCVPLPLACLIGKECDEHTKPVLIVDQMHCERIVPLCDFQLHRLVYKC